MASSNDTQEATEKFTEHSSLYLPPISSVSFPSAGKRPTQDVTGLPSPVGPPMPVLSREDHQVSHPDTATDLQHTPRSTAEPPIATQGEAGVPLEVTGISAPLLIQCMMCGAPPTTGTQPTVSMCGHLFCYEYVLSVLYDVVERLTLH